MQLRVSRAARSDLIRIWAFIAEDNPSRADTFLDEFYATFKRLSDNPEMGRRRDELRTGIRSFSQGKYVVFYTFSDERNELDIVRVLSGYRDLDALLAD
jgi:toxin ParE1/3/4